jgi:hypothetical protein
MATDQISRISSESSVVLREFVAVRSGFRTRLNERVRWLPQIQVSETAQEIPKPKFPVPRVTVNAPGTLVTAEEIKKQGDDVILRRRGFGAQIRDRPDRIGQNSQELRVAHTTIRGHEEKIRTLTRELTNLANRNRELAEVFGRSQELGQLCEWFGGLLPSLLPKIANLFGRYSAMFHNPTTSEQTTNELIGILNQCVLPEGPILSAGDLGDIMSNQLNILNDWRENDLRRILAIAVAKWYEHLGAINRLMLTQEAEAARL